LNLGQELWETLRKLSALEARTEDVMRGLERLEDKIDSLLDRVSRVEVQYQSLRENVRNEILADVRAEVAVVRFALERRSVQGIDGRLESGQP
jgi:hypothetical protein